MKSVPEKRKWLSPIPVRRLSTPPDPLPYCAEYLLSCISTDWRASTLTRVLNNPVVTDSVPMPISLPPATVDDTTRVRTPSKSFAQTIFVQPDVLAFLAGNQTLLPPLPFNMTVVMTITAISDSGDSFDTNEISYNVIVLAPAL